MSVSASDITTRFSEFAAVATATIDLAITDATLSVNRARWGDKADLATVYLAAHLLVNGGWGAGAGAAGAVIKKKVGDLDKTFAAPTIATTDSELGITKYGRLFLRLRKEIVKTPLVLNYNQDYDT